MKKAAGIQQALSDGDYVSALQIDPSNTEALLMKKVADLQQALVKGDVLPPPEMDTAVLALCSSGLERQAQSDFLGALQLLNHVPSSYYNKMIAGKSYSVSNVVARLNLKISKGHIQS